MKYLLLVYMDENAMNETERAQCYKESAELSHDLHRSGQLLGVNPAAAGCRRHDIARTRWQTAHHRWPIRRDARTTWRILPCRCSGPKRRDQYRDKDSRREKGSIEIRPILEIAGLPSET